MRTVRVGAKVNLALNVLGKEGKMHLLSGLYLSCALSDIITLSARMDDKISVSYVGGGGYENDSAYRMAQLLCRRYATPGVDIIIEKNIPESRGLGGSSADAAGVARAFSEEFSTGEIEDELLLSVGSDVPFQYRGGCALVSGRGEKIQSVSLPKLYLAILCPPKGVSTADCFSLYDTVGGENGDVESLISGLCRREKVLFFNALERAACALVEEIGKGKEILQNAGFVCGMTGSGSALFGVEYDEGIYREKLKKVALPEGYILLETTTEGNL